MSSSSTSSPYTILIVDDNRDLLESMRFAIETLGDGQFNIEVASDGAQGLERAYELIPDCMVIDVKMPTMNGYQLVLALRGDPKTASIPLVILSALVQERDQIAGMLAGADQYLTKPAPPQKIVAAIRECIRITEQERRQRLENFAKQAIEGEDMSNGHSGGKDRFPLSDDGAWRRRG